MSMQPQRSGSLSYPRLQSPAAKPRWTMRSAPIATAKQLARRSRETLVVLIAVLTYFFVRGLMSTSVDRAHDHAYALLDLERSLGIAWEADLQRWAHGVPWLMSAMNSVYIYGHWPVIALTLGWLLLRHGDRFRTYRTAMVLSGLIGFAFFALYPMAPPRFLPELGFVDTVMRDTSSYRVLQPPAFTNQYAAMPSLHVGWNLLMGIAIWSTTTHRFWRAFAVVMPVAMYIATILTANHFVLDGVVGSVVALAGLAIARQLASPRKGDVHEPARAPAGSGG
jgi:hypothetical protein